MIRTNNSFGYKIEFRIIDNCLEAVVFECLNGKEFPLAKLAGEEWEAVARNIDIPAAFVLAAKKLNRPNIPHCVLSGIHPLKIA